MERHPRSNNFVPLVPTPLPSGLQPAGASGWYNLTAWAVNVTRYAPFLEELVWAGPRMFMKLGSYMALSEPVDMPTAHHYAPATVGADLLRPIAADFNLYNILEPNPSLSAFAGHASLGGAAEDPLTHASRLSLDGARGLGSVFSYATSRWALSCIAMAIVLNRTHIFAATRRRLRFRWHIRLLLRLAPILLLGVQVYRLLQSIQCQSSLEFSRLRWGDSDKSSDLMFSHPSALLNTLSSALLFGATDEQSCVAVGMTPARVPGASQSLQGSLSLLWPLFGTFCLSHFLETVSCAVQGRPVAAETGMTLFEQSLAFAEADAAISNQLGWGAFSKTQQASDQGSSNIGSAIALTRSMILKRVNTAPEVLLVAFLSSMTHITSHVLGVFDLQAKYRLINTGFWGLCFMSSIVWSAFSFELGNPSAQGLLRFPTVCIIGFVPHVLVLAGIATCVCIYGLALLLSALAPPADEQLSSMSLRQRLAHAHNNMQANVSISDIRITWEMDFYTALLRTGFAAITMASEAVYLNEDRGVSLQRHTWLEEARFREVEELQRQCIGMGLPNSRHDQIGTIGLIPIKGGSVAASNGYARERAAQKLPKGRGERGLRVGTGATERSSRWLMALEFLLSISKLVARVGALFFLWVLGAIRIRAQPSWLLWLARRPKTTDDEKNSSKLERDPRGEKTPTASNDYDRSLGTDGIDVEAEFRRLSGFGDEAKLDNDLYRYWLKGGWWGSSDSSGDFEPTSPDDDWDLTSVVSSTSAGDDVDEEESEWESEDGGSRTPTQRSPRPWCDNGDSAPVVDSSLGMGDLARLLHPTSREERDEALTLAAHFQSNAVMTRARFRRLEHLRRTRILTTSGLGGTLHGAGGEGPMGRHARLGPDDEERLLEQLLLSRRQASSGAEHAPPSAVPGGVDGSAGRGESPLCVVCQSSSRTIIVWPCRCLSLCDDCRVSLAMNNFDKCVCCRRDVMSFSRIFVP